MNNEKTIQTQKDLVLTKMTEHKINNKHTNKQFDSDSDTDNRQQCVQQ